MLRKLVAVSIIALICASLVSAYTGVSGSSNATNNSSPVPVTNAGIDTDTNANITSSELVLNDSSVDNSSFPFSDQNTSSNVIHDGNAVAENHTNVTSEAAVEAEGAGNRSSGKNNTGNKTDMETVPGAMPDLVVTSIEAVEPLFAGELNLVKARIKNAGRDAGSFWVSLHVNGTETPVDTERIPSLAFDTETVVTFGWVPDEAGDYILNVTVDANNEITESNETNNHEEKCVHVHPAPSWHYEHNITVEN